MNGWLKKHLNYVPELDFKKIFVITKRNILKETDGIFVSAVEKIKQDFNGIEIEEYYIDNVTQQLVKNPQRFNNSILLSTIYLWT